ncbi:MAG: response regulator [Candidatus Latescibacterota bacterium]
MAVNPTPKVLIIDDEPGIVEMIQSLLDMHGYESVATTQWTEALDAAEHETPNLMLLDLNMPTIDGVSLLKFFREQGYTFPVVVVSGFIDEEIRDSLRPYGVVDFVDKPFEIRHLSTVIAAVLASQVPADTDVLEEIPPLASSELPAVPTIEPSPEPPPLPLENLPQGVLAPRKESRRRRERVMVPPPRKPSFFSRSLVQYFIIALVCFLLAGFLIVVVKRSQEVPLELYPNR